MPRDFIKIKAWQHADDLCVKVYQMTRRFPKEELYGITSQVRRAAVSVAANIAEGAARQTNKDYLHFLHIAAASLAEVRYHLHLSRRLEYLNSDEYADIEASHIETASTLRGLIKAVEIDTGTVSTLAAVLASSVALYTTSGLASVPFGR
jgi:four helix bundle protein